MSLVRRVLSFAIDLLAIAVVLALSAVVWVPVAMFAAVGLASRWDWTGWGLGLAGTIAGAVVVVSGIYLIRGVARGGTWGMRRCGLGITRDDGRRPTAGQALVRYLVGFLLPVMLPVLLSVAVSAQWEAQHARKRPPVTAPASSIVAPAEAVLAEQQWEETGRWARWWLELLPGILYGAEALLMLAWIVAHPAGQGWHDQAAGTVVRRATPISALT